MVSSEAANVHDYDLVGCLCLAIRLRMERRRHVKFDASEAHELLPEDGGEYLVPIQDNRLRDAV
jgi:hypothetical protein